MADIHLTASPSFYELGCHTDLTWKAIALNRLQSRSQLLIFVRMEIWADRQRSFTFFVPPKLALFFGATVFVWLCVCAYVSQMLCRAELSKENWKAVKKKTRTIEHIVRHCHGKGEGIRDDWKMNHSLHTYKYAACNLIHILSYFTEYFQTMGHIEQFNRRSYRAMPADTL